MKNIRQNKFMEKGLTSWSADSWSLFSNPSQTAQSIFFYMQETGCFHTFYPYYTERENLNSFLILHTISGRGILCCQGQEYELGPGSSFFINCMDYHKYFTPECSRSKFLSKNLKIIVKTFREIFSGAYSAK